MRLFSSFIPTNTSVSLPSNPAIPMIATAMVAPTPAPPAALECNRSDQEVVELPLLLPRWQAEVLEAAATRRGMTTGQILRRVIGDLFGGAPGSPEASTNGR